MTYKNKLDNIEFSFSTLHQYEQCPYAFYLKKIGDGEELNEGNYYSDIGGFIHDIHEEILTGKLDIENVIDYFIDNYSNYVVYETKQSTMDKKYNQAIDYFAEFDPSKLKDYEILGVEKEVHFKIDKYKFIGFIDLLLRDRRSGRIILVDHKSSDHFLKKNGEPLKNQLSQFEAYSKQMYLYSKAIFDEYGEYPDRIVWNHFFDLQVTNIPFDFEKYDEAVKWAIKTIEEIFDDKEFVNQSSYMMCKVLCGYRNSCDYAREVD